MVDTLNAAARKLPTWSVYVAGAAAAAWLWYLAATGGLGPEPINALTRELGLVGLQLVVLGLAITPLRRFAGVNLLRFRRAIGVTAFFFIAQHLGVWLVLDVGDAARIWADIIKRPYVTVGMVGFLMLLPLAITSNDASVRRLGAARWRSLHRLTYGVALAGAIHFLWLVKGWPLEPFLYAIAILLLLGLRLIPKTRRAAA